MIKQASISMIALCLASIQVMSLQAQRLQRDIAPRFYAPGNHAELEWQSLETDNFFVHYHKGAERSAQVTAKIAEEIHGPITELYGFTPSGKTHFIIRDHDDISNGAAYYYDNKVEIWASAMDFDLRGTHNWLRNVITHEYIHMIQLQASRKVTQKIPAMYLQWIGYEQESRPDVLRGYPNTIILYPIPFTIMPSWFAEGVAQYQIPGLGYDHFDSHRDMLLRTVALQDSLLSFAQMSSFGKNSLGNERAYNQGFSLVGYMAERFGLQSLRTASEAMSSLPRASFSSAIKKATGVSGDQLYSEWKAHIRADYATRMRTIEDNAQAGEFVQNKGIGNFHPVWSASGDELAYLSGAGSDYLSATRLVIRDMATGREQLIQAGTQTAFDWSRDGRFMVFAKRSRANRYGSRYFDIYVRDRIRDKVERLTTDFRAHSPALSGNNEYVAFVVNGDGTQNLAVMKLKNKRIKMLTAFKNGEQVFKPEWHPDGKRLVFSFTRGEGRQLQLMDVKTQAVTPVRQFGNDDRDAVWSPDGSEIYFASDRTGIFNIYALNPESGTLRQLTNVTGGAFMPAINDKNQLAYSCFVAGGYKIAMIDQPAEIKPEQAVYHGPPTNGEAVALTNGLSKLDISKIKAPNFDDRIVEPLPATPYKNRYASVSIVPRVMRDYGTTKLGTYVFSNDVLNNYSIIAGAAANSNVDIDLFGIAEFNRFGPTIYLEAFNQITRVDIEQDKLTYNLSEVGLGVRSLLRSLRRHHLQLGFIYGRYNAKIKSRDQRGNPFSFGYSYHIGRAAQLRYDYYGIAPAIDAQANPRAGRVVSIEYRRYANRFNESGEFRVNERFGTVQEVYTPYNYNELTLDWREYLSMPGKTGLGLRLRGGFIDDGVNDFYHFFGGGLDGNRGYPFYSMEGSRLMHGTLSYRVPLLQNMNFSFLHLYFDKLFAGVFVDVTRLSNDNSFELSEFRRSIGGQLRLETFSFYGFPTRFFFDAAYGLDDFSNRAVKYGKEWRYYFGITFDYFD